MASNYLHDLGELLAEMATRAKDEYQAGRSSEEASYLLGRLTAMHEVISLMQQQAMAFGLPLQELSLEGIDPDRDLL